MVFSESQLSYSNNTYSLNEGAKILNSATYLDESVGMLSPVAVPIVVNESLGHPVAHYADISRIADENGVGYMSAIHYVAEANNIDFDDLLIAVPEHEILANPSIVNEMNNVVAVPTSSNDIVYTFMETCMNCFFETGDFEFLDMLNADTIEELNESKKKTKNSGATPVTPGTPATPVASGSPAATAGGSTGDAEEQLSIFEKLKDNLINKPRTFLVRKLQWLNNWANRHLRDIESKPEEEKTIWMKIKKKVFEIINWITKKLGATEAKYGDVDPTTHDYTMKKNYDD